MPKALEITLILVLIALALGLLPLLFQLRQTAKSLDSFLLSSKKDLNQIAEDVRASRLQMNHLVASIQASLEEFSSYARVMGEIATGVKHLHDRFQGSFESASINLGMLLGGLSAVLAFFKSRSSQPPTT